MTKQSGLLQATLMLYFYLCFFFFRPAMDPSKSQANLSSKPIYFPCLPAMFTLNISSVSLFFPVPQAMIRDPEYFTFPPSATHTDTHTQ